MEVALDSQNQSLNTSKATAKSYQPSPHHQSIQPVQNPSLNLKVLLLSNRVITFPKQMQNTKKQECNDDLKFFTLAKLSLVETLDYLK